MSQTIIDVDEVSKRIFILTVAAASIVPRMPFDKPWTIGGNLSHGFRCLVVLVAVSNTARNVARVWLPEEVNLVLFAVECLITSFMSLLVPYVLRSFLADRVNLPGHNLPGNGLVHWMYLVFAISLVGVTLRVVTDNADFWVLKKLGDSLTFVPVLKTLLIYNRVSSARAVVPGRGPVLSQMLLVIECYCLLVHSSDIALRVLKISRVADWTHHVFYHSMYTTSSHYAVCTRLLGHSILLNVIDESSSTSCPSTMQPEDEADQDLVELGAEELALLPR